jgi:amidophosphoribosyltransferase
MCGIIGIYDYENVSAQLIQGLSTLQHRGHDAAGIVTFNGNFHLKKGLGNIDNVFDEKDIEALRGYCGLGHVRYTTIGSTDPSNAQPFAVNYPYGLAMVHNGNVTNFNQLKKWLYEENHRLVETSNDVELILYTLASEIEKKDLKNLTVDDIFDAVQSVQNLVEGAYSVLTIIANTGFLAFTDPHGIRPLLAGKRTTEKGVTYAFASESTTFDYLGYKTIRDIEPGEMIFIDTNRKIHTHTGIKRKQAFCVFEYIYFAREDSVLHNRLVASERVKMGKMLAKRIKKAGVEPDIIIDVPNSAYFAASGLAEELNVPYRRGLAKNHNIGRSFITPTQEKRELMVKQKLNPIRDIVRDKKIAVVDDSIIRGTTSRHIVHLLRDFGAKEIYFISASPPVKYQCIYGIDMSVKGEMLASKNSIEEISQYIGADAVIYQSLKDLRDLYKDLPICDACFSCEYPTEVSEETLEEIELEKIQSCR